MELLHIENLSFTYNQEPAPALRDICLSVASGEFVLFCGQSGCGKTTLLRLLKPALAPAGDLSGSILYGGQPLSLLDAHRAASEIGFVMQHPESQVVTDKVWHELAFGLENLGVSTEEIRRRVGEMASFFGIQTWFRDKTAELSGGQKQLLNLASIMVMNPGLLILDEPTSQLDPIGAADFIATLQKINKELGTTILLAEHRLEGLFPIADKVVVMDNGSVLVSKEPREAGRELRLLAPGHPMLSGLPSAVRIFHATGAIGECPLTVRQGRDYLSSHFDNKIRRINVHETELSSPTALELEEGWYRYEQNSQDILRGLSLRVHQGETFSILGGNGTGKTTALKIMAGQSRLYRGKLKLFGKPIKEYTSEELYRHNIAMLPQNPQSSFVKFTVEEELDEVCRVMNDEPAEAKARILELTERLAIDHLLLRHPYDLSGGEQQKVALAKVLLLRPRILLLDEPTKGIDAHSKEVLRRILNELKTDGVTIIMVSHDVEFAALTSDRCAMFFDGQLVSVGTPNLFFSTNTFYTTAASRISRHRYDNAVSCEDVVGLCKENGAPQ
jgi:energy-coupling factor transport system ATP-binding protein